MSSHRWRALWLGLAFLFTVSMGAAQEFQEDTTEPAEQVSGGIHFLSGGIGADERALLAARAKAYNLVLIFRRRNASEALTDVAVTIATPMGKVLVDTLSEGPMFLARLPKGRYVVQAAHGGQPLKRAVVIGSRSNTQGRRLILRWSASSNE